MRRREPPCARATSTTRKPSGNGCADVEGQVRGLQRMVDEDRYCIDILEQVSAATKALQAVALELLDDHLAHCVSDAVRQGGDEATESSTRHPPRSGGWFAPDSRVLGRRPPNDRGLGWTSGARLREGFFMFWETLWPLDPRFRAVRCRPGLRQPRRHAAEAGRPPSGRRRPGLGLRHGLSSCSYAASAMAKSLFAKGADYIAAMVFMFASTNLVHRARRGARRPHGMAVRRQRVRRRHRHDRPAGHLGALWLRGRRSWRPASA